MPAGSSPLTRGKRLRSGRLGRWPGLIPAHAGKTGTAGYGCESPRAHPRSRGENSPWPFVRPFTSGSSPLTRGKPVDAGLPRGGPGLIPAHAGKTVSERARVFVGGAHPRSRGENRACDSHSAATAGSSPLTRGKRRRGCSRTARRGLIPAHAGKTAGGVKSERDGGAHPRSRGENPPHGAPPGTSVGLIPAHAGKTHWESPPARPRRAHPRSRGENTSRPKRAIRMWGSSPLTRGKRLHAPRHLVDAGLIPAHAGKTSWRLR